MSKIKEFFHDQIEVGQRKGKIVNKYKHNHRNFTDEDKRMMYEMIYAGQPGVKVAEYFNTSYTTVKNIVEKIRAKKLKQNTI
jgi:DNA invertase Pin-like site-specific DNA recombinase